MATKFKVDELKGFFKTVAEIEKRIEEIAPRFARTSVHARTSLDSAITMTTAFA